MIFAYDWSQQRLVYPHPVTGQPLAISVGELGQIGWTFRDGDARRCLPRADKSLIQSANMQIPQGVLRNGGRR